MKTSVFSFVLDLLYPKFCVNCGEYGVLLCENCYSNIEKCNTKTCFFCGRISKLGKVCEACQNKNKTSFHSVIWCGSFKGALKEMIHSYKYDKFLELSEILAEMAIETLMSNNNLKNSIVVPVPIYKKKQALRGFNQTEEIARIFSKKLGMHGGLALKKIKSTDSQMGLNRVQRLNNLVGSFECFDTELIKGKNILLFDDVATTGATINECAKTLKLAGAKKIDVFVLARD